MKAMMAKTSKYCLHAEDIRPAEADESERVALVAAAAFYSSPANAYERPYRDEYPGDTFLSYLYQMLEYLWEPDCILVVAEDKLEKSEDEELYPALRRVHGGREWPEKGGKVVVGIACLKLKKGSKREGKYQPIGEKPEIPDEDNRPKRDQSKIGMENLSNAIEPSIKQHFNDEFSIDMVAVHPTYWRRYHGTSLLSWAAQIADEDRIRLGIASVPMGIAISCRVEFEQKAEIEVRGYSEHPESFTAWIGVREPQVQKGWIPSWLVFWR